MREFSDRDAEVIRALRLRLTGTSQNADGKFELIVANVRQLVEESGSPDLNAYLQYVASHTSELARLVSALTIHTTWFFREKAQFNLLSDALRHHPIQRGRTFRLLNAGCSTGQETWSAALVLDHFRKQCAEKFDWEVIGIDIDPLSVERAKQAEYGRDERSHIPDHLLPGLEKSSRGLGFTLGKELRHRTSFHVRSLLDLGGLAGSFDWIFCRNVLLYFSDEQRTRIVNLLAERLRPHGTLCLGLCENVPVIPATLKAGPHSQYERIAPKPESSPLSHVAQMCLPDAEKSDTVLPHPPSPITPSPESVSGSVREIPIIGGQGKLKGRPKPVDMILIGASTGGTVALPELLRDIGPDTPPIVVVQHMEHAVIARFAERLATKARLRYVEAGQNETLAWGSLYLPTGNYHFTLHGASAPYRLRQLPNFKQSPYCPAVNVLFESVLKTRARVAAVLLTGMGDDGAKGLLALRQMGQMTFVQNAETCAVFGMPREALHLGAACFVGSPTQIRAELARIIAASLEERARNPEAEAV